MPDTAPPPAPTTGMGALIANLRHRQAWAAICAAYLRKKPKPDVAAFLQRLMEVEMEAVEELAAMLRQHSVAPGRVPAQEELVADALARSSNRGRIQFVHVGLQRSLDWYDERLAAEDDPFRPLWQTLRTQLAPLAAETAALLQQIEKPAQAPAPRKSRNRQD